MVNYDTVSAKLPPELRQKIKKYKIPISDTIRDAFEDKVKEIELEELEKRAQELAPLFNRIKTEDVVKMIREDRESR